MNYCLDNNYLGLQRHNIKIMIVITASVSVFAKASPSAFDTKNHPRSDAKKCKKTKDPATCM